MILQLKNQIAAGGHSSCRRQKEVGSTGPQCGGPALSRHLLEAARRRDSFWLLVFSPGGGLAKQLLHGFELD
jgi:hypothetical protein